MENASEGTHSSKNSRSISSEESVDGELQMNETDTWSARIEIQ